MNVVYACREYILKMVTEVSGMKSLLLDEDTASIVSMVYTQSEILQKEVFLVDRVDSTGREKMGHLKCVVFVRPSADSIHYLCEELRNPKYGQYYIYFSNIIQNGQLERLAEADEQECVREVQEFFGDYISISQQLFSLNIPFSIGPGGEQWAGKSFERTCEGVVSILLALKKRPVIRYQQFSSLGKRLAQEISYTMQQEASLFDFRRPDTPPVLLIMDRRDDPITPLLNQWTYRAMIHELLGIQNNRVDLSKVPGIKPDMKEVVLNGENDDFYKQNIFSNFGEIGANIKILVDDFQQKTKSNAKIESIEDMKSFMESYPQFKALSGTVSKHVTCVSELSRLVDVNSLLDVSEAEQEIANQGDHATCLAQVKDLIKSQKVSDFDKARLAILYAIRFERHNSNELSKIIDLLYNRGVPEELIKNVASTVQFAGQSARQSDLFGNKSILGFTKKALKGLKGVENIYTQHEPLLAEVLDQLVKGRLKETSFPFLGNSLRDRPQEIIVFFIGGATYEEAQIVSAMNNANPGVRIVLGGTTIHNCKSFLQEAQRSAVGKVFGGKSNRTSNFV
eukprot:Nk52_evm54s215 gene=Nk52_evmTU54s215